MLKNSSQLVTLSQNHMATTFSLTLSVPRREIRRAESCLNEAHALIDRHEKDLSEFLPESPIYRWNQASPDNKPKLKGRALDLLKVSTTLEELTGRAFSPFAKGTGISFGAIGKGYTLDGVRDLIDSWGYKNYLLNAGGSSLLLSGFASPENPWKVGWSVEGKDISYSLTHFTGHAIALGISGTSEKGFHILDPQTGAPIAHAKSALVSHPSAAYADALSTALFVAGWKSSINTFSKFIEKPGLALVDKANETSWNGTFEKQWGPLN